MKKAILPLVILTSLLASCGQQTNPEQPVQLVTASEGDIQKAEADMLNSRPEAKELLNKMGFTSLAQLESGKFYTLSQDGKLTISDSPFGSQKSGITAQGGIGSPAIKETIDGIVAGQLSARSKASLACADFDPFDGIEAKATVTHTITTLGPNGRTFGPYTSTTATGYGYAATADKFMGGATTASGNYTFDYLYEGSCDGARTLSRGKSIWNVNGTNVKQVASLNLIPY